MNADQLLDLIVAKTERNRSRFRGELVGAAVQNGIYFLNARPFQHIEHWTHSFYTGMLALSYLHTGRGGFLKELYRFAPMYRQKLKDDGSRTMHDLGFLYSLYAVALYELTGDLQMRRLALDAAGTLGRRFQPGPGIVRAWGRMDSEGTPQDGLMIVDCLMNLPLLLWAWRETGHVWYRDIAVRHADQALRFLLREDGSVCHAFKFDPASGTPEGVRNDCGYSEQSAWARGTAWALYGFSLAYRYTGRARYLEAAQRLAAFFLSQLPPDRVPLWDFRLPPDAPQLRDSSAAAIAVCGLLELAELHGSGEASSAATTSSAPDYREEAGRILEALCRPPYFAADRADTEAVLDLAQTGPHETGTIWGDYFLMEALMRRKGRRIPFWYPDGEREMTR